MLQDFLENYRNYICISTVAGILLDLILGDPDRMPHPVRGLGRLIDFLTGKLLKKEDSGEQKRRKGQLLAVLVVGSTVFIASLILYLTYAISVGAGLLVQTVMCYQIMAMKSLKTESMRVYDKLKAGNLYEARTAVSMIVGRDTEMLDEAGVTRATVETVAENTSDGVIAPLLFLLLGGPVLGFVYKAVNTMDSMVGYKNEVYLDYGRAAAKLDDIVNYIPARVSAYMMLIASFFCGLSVKNAYRIYKRDHRKHASPNSAQTESVCAGALQVQLAGNACYFGKMVEKPYIGDPEREITYEDIKTTNRLLYVTAFCSMAVFLLLRYFIANLYL